MSSSSIATTPDHRRDATRGTKRASAAGRGPEGLAARAPEAPLGTYANSSSPAGQPGTGFDPEVDHKSGRYGSRRGLWEASSLARVRSCGRYSTEEDGSVGIKVTPGQDGGNVSGFRGVTTCGSVWACPVCSAKIAAHRAQDLSQAVEHYTADGKSVYMITLTMRHHRGQSLHQCWSALSYAWNAANSGKQAKADKELFELDGYNRVTEVTHGEHGWHVHAHVVLFFDREIGAESVKYLAHRMYQRWEKALHRKGFDAIEEHALDVRKADEWVADYLAKTTYNEDPQLKAASEAYAQACTASAKKLASEAALGVFKDARRGNRTPFKILESIFAGQQIGADTSEDERLWYEWEKESRGRRQMVWSRGLRDRVGLDKEKDDTEIVEDDEMQGEVVAYMPKATWNVIKWEAEFLLQAFDHSTEAGFGYLGQRGLAVHTADGSEHPL